MLRDRTVRESRERGGLKREPGATNVFMNGFSAQIYGNVGVALFYLTGSYTRGDAVRNGTWRVTAVWVHENGVWKEAHHHESPLVAGNHP